MQLRLVQLRGDKMSVSFISHALHYSFVHHTLISTQPCIVTSAVAGCH